MKLKYLISLSVIVLIYLFSCNDPSDSFQLNTIPDAPSGLSGTAESGIGVHLSWTDNADNEESFTIERNLDGAGYVPIAVGLAANTESYSDTDFDLYEEHSFEYRVFATNSVGNSEYSNELLVNYSRINPSCLIIDHESIAEFDLLTPSQIAEAKKVLMIIAGESHVKAYWSGLQLIEDQDPAYSVEVTVAGRAEDYSDEYIRFERYYYNGSDWIDTMGEEDFFTNAAARSEIVAGLEYIDSKFSGTVLFGLGWCWDMTDNNLTVDKDPVYDVSWAGSSVAGPEGDRPWGIDDDDTSITGNSVNLQTYLDAVDLYNSLGLENTITIFTTGPVDKEKDTEKGYQRWLKHEAIREHVRTNGGILFDYADILSWDNGVQYISSWDGRAFPVGDPDLAPAGIDGYAGSHISEAGCLLLGKALWVLAAKAGEWLQ